ncbi:hypothetical protein KEM55_008833 [Ascosphaera atra]|nr:hypothetical protein KEM55_008833 [Ascosphaera atra]
MFRSPPPPPPLPPRLRTPVYVPPEAAPEGFTRTVRESEVVVCPNCGHELGTDAEDEVQKQIWVVKQCGHVYCGLCARNRAQKNRRRGAPAVKTKPFSKCVVEGCEKNVTQPSTMLQVYL